MSIEKLKMVSEQITGRISAVQGKGEEATKQALVLPVLDALGYDIWNPLEVCPEFQADFVIKKSGQKEKVDIALIFNQAPRVYIEVKSIETNLNGHEGQLARYFNSTQSVALAILTNGIEWRFFTDTGDPNIMDLMPFHISKLTKSDRGLDVLARFAKAVFSPESIRDYATELLYTAKIAKFLRSEIVQKGLREPSEYFIRWILKSDDMYSGIVNQNVVDRFSPIVKAGLKRVIRELVRRALSAMEGESPTTPDSTSVQETGTDEVENEDCCEVMDLDEPERKSGTRIITTEKELDCFAIIKSIFEKSPYRERLIKDRSQRKEIPVDIAYKDTSSYFGIYFNKPSWWILRINIESKNSWVGFNLPLDMVAEIIPPGFEQLPGNAYADFRLAINSPDDFKSLVAVLFAAFDKVIEERK